MKVTVNNQKHGFNLVDPSPWPLITAFSALMLTFGCILYMHGYVGGSSLLQLGVCMVLFMMFVWWRGVIREGTFKGQHTFIVPKVPSRGGVSNPYLILFQMFILARLQIACCTAFYGTVLLQLLSGYNLFFFLCVFWCAFILAHIFEVCFGYCDLKLKNALIDAILFASIFFASALCYVQAWKAKVKSLTEQIYVLLSQLQASLEAEIDVINAKELAYNNIAVKTAIIILLLTSIALFAYWWLGGGGDDSGGGGGTPTDSISSQGSGVGSNETIKSASNAMTANADIAESALDAAVNVIRAPLDLSVAETVGSSVLTTLGLMNKYSLSISKTKKFLLSFSSSISEFKEILKCNKNFTEGTVTSQVKALKNILVGLENVQLGLGTVTVAADDIRVTDVEREELHQLSERLLKLLESQPEFSAMNDNAFPALCSVGLFFHMVTQGTESISAIEKILILLKDKCINWLNKCLANKCHPDHVKTDALIVVDDLINEIDGFCERFNFWSNIGEAGEHTSASKFFKRFKDLCQNVKGSNPL